jgi:hypothetical protein
MMNRNRAQPPSDPMHSRDLFARDVKPSGEGWVWITSMGLGVGLVMIAFLLGMIVYNGLEVFWPKPVVRLELVAGSDAGIRGAPAFGGEIVKTQDKAVRALGPDGRPLPATRTFTVSATSSSTRPTSSLGPIRPGWSWPSASNTAMPSSPRCALSWRRAR